MREKVFQNISPDPTTKNDAIPDSSFLYIRDILDHARFTLRRRTEKEVRDRAILILAKLAEFHADIETFFQDEPEYFKSPPDDAGDLDWLMLPERTYQFQRTIKENINDIPWAADTGWINAEDLAVLALVKADAAVGYLNSSNEGNEAAMFLLDAYRCCLRAVEEGGQHIQTEKEYLETLQYYENNKKKLMAWQSADGINHRATQKLKLIVFNEYKKLRRDHPEYTPYKIAKIITEMCEEEAPAFKQYKNAVPRDRFKRFYDWILDFKKGKTPLPIHPKNAESLLQFYAYIKKKRQQNHP